jgi:type II secretory pathway pseudopilin PulG
MKHSSLPPGSGSAASRSGWTLVETLVTCAVIAVLAGISYPVYTALRQNSLKADAMQRMGGLATAFVSYTTDNGGNLPLEDATGPDDWTGAANPVNAQAWYNALPPLMSSEPVGSLGNTPELFYAQSYPLYLKGATYPESDKRLRKPFFAVAMNSRLQRKSEDGVKKPGLYVNIKEPSRTVIFLERGLPDEKKSMGVLGPYDGDPKANPRAFVARYNQKGILIFADGHAELHPASDLITTSGLIPFPQTGLVWTNDPAEDPN